MHGWGRIRIILAHLTILVLACAPVLVGCLPVVAVREATYRPAPSDPYAIWGAHVTDSGLLLLCGRVDNGEESMEQVSRVYNLELRLFETLDPHLGDQIQIVQIDADPSLVMGKGYLTDLCQFDEKRETRRPDETGWTEIYVNRWDESFVELTGDDISAGRLPVPPDSPRVVLYEVYESDPPQYLLMGRLREIDQNVTLLLILGNEHIQRLW